MAMPGASAQQEYIAMVEAAAIRAAVDGLNRYPDGAFHVLRHRLAALNMVDPSQVVLGNGADSILLNLSIAMLRPGDEVSIIPAFAGG